MIYTLKMIPNVWKFFGLVCFFYGGLFFISSELFFTSFHLFIQLFKKISYSFVFVFLFIYIFNVFISDAWIQNYLTKKIKFQHYLLIAFVGILSTGPIYLWFSYLSKMKKQGMRDDLISLFLYNRSIKLPLIPLLIEYFSFKITIIIMLLIFFFSFINAFLISYFLSDKYRQI